MARRKSSSLNMLAALLDKNAEKLSPAGQNVHEMAMVVAFNRADVRKLANEKAVDASDEMHYGVAPYVACGFAQRSTMDKSLVTCATCLGGIATNDARKAAARA